MGRSVLFCLPAAGLALPAPARKERDATSLDAERDALIDKIARGVEVDESVRRFKQLVEERDRRVATSQAAVDRERQKSDARRAWRAAYEKSLDHEVGRRCTLRGRSGASAAFRRGARAGRLGPRGQEGVAVAGAQERARRGRAGHAL